VAALLVLLFLLKLPLPSRIVVVVFAALDLAASWPCA